MCSWTPELYLSSLNMTKIKLTSSRTDNTKNTAINKLYLSVRSGEKLALVGPSGRYVVLYHVDL